MDFEIAEQFKTELARIPGMVAMSAASHDFGNGNWANLGYTDDKGTYRIFNFNSIDDDHIPMMKMQILAGRNHFGPLYASHVRI